jgi:omega-amidase
VVGVNRIGHDPNGLAYAGDTMLVGFDGEVLLSAAHTETTLSATLLREQLLGYRERLPFLRDRDAFRLA